MYNIKQTIYHLNEYFYSQVDPKGDDLLNNAMSADKSSEWFAKRNIKKADG